MLRKRGRSLSFPRRASRATYSIENLEPRTLFSAYPNVLVNNPALDTTSADTQSTTAVIAFGSTVVIAYDDSGSSAGGAQHYIGYARSTDGGQSFTDLGHLPDTAKGDSIDPALARDNTTGAIYLACRSDAHGIQIFKSTDDGLTFSSLATVFTSGLGLQDKPSIVIDNSPGSGQGNVYVGFRTVGPVNGMSFSRSSNGGATFTTTTVNAQGGTQAFNAARVVVAPDHSIDYFWLDGTSGTSKIDMIKSTDRGATFSAPITVATLAVATINTSIFNSTRDISNADLGLGFQTFAYPQATVNPITGNLYVVYPDKTASHGTDIFLTQSTDAGQTWSTPSRINDDTTANDQWQPSLAIKPDGSQLFVGFYDRRNDPANTLIDTYGAIADINGSSLNWHPNFRITDTSFAPIYNVDPTVSSAISSLYMGDYDNSYADNSGFYYAWGDNRNDAVFRAGKQADVRFAKIAQLFNVADTNPSAGATVNSALTDFSVVLTSPYDPASVQPSDLTVNGIPADSVTFTDGQTLAFRFNTTPVSAPGQQTLAIASGAIVSLVEHAPVSAFSSAFNYDPRILTNAPGQPDLLPGSDTGISDTDNITNLNNSSPTRILQFSIPGAIPGATVRLYADNLLVGSTLTTDTTAVVTTDGSTQLLDGTHSFSATQTVPGQQESGTSLHLIVTIMTAPAVPAAPILTAASDSGVSHSDRITNITTPTFSTVFGTSYFRFYQDGQLFSSPYATGSFFTVPALADGTYSFTIAAVDTAGNVSVQSAPTVVTIDTVAPPPPVAVLDTASDSGISSSDGLTNQTNPTFDVQTSEAGQIQLKIDGLPVNSPIPVPSAGIYKITRPNAQTFLPYTLTPFPGDAYSDFSVDLNNDGKTDLLAGDTGGTVYSYISNGDGTFTRQGGGFSQVTGIGATDINGDGYMDVVITTFNPVTNSGGSLITFFGNGTGQFTQQTVTTFLGTSCRLAALQDFNGDGKLDALYTDFEENDVRIAFGDGTGAFRSPQIIYSAPGSFSASIAVGDFNSDGRLDFAGGTTDSHGNPVTLVFSGNGNGTFQPPVTLGPGSGGTYSTGDFNRDGRIDIACADYNGNSIHLFLNSVSGTFSESTISGLKNPSGMVVADFNHDGFLDLATSNETAQNPQTLIFSGNGDGTFQIPLGLPVAIYPLGTAVGDFNGDGLPDLAVPCYQAECLSILMNSASALSRGAHSATAYSFDLAGNISAPSAAVTFTIDAVSPTVSIPPVSPFMRDTGISSLPITFSKPVFGLSTAQFILQRDNTTISLSTATLSTPDHIHWTLGNLDSLTSAAGVYFLSLIPTATTDAAGNPTANGAFVSFSVRAITLTPGQDISIRAVASTAPGMTDIFINNSTSVPNYTWTLSNTAPLLVIDPGISDNSTSISIPAGISLPSANTNINILGGQFAINSDIGASAANVNLSVFSSSAITFLTSQHLASLNITGGSVTLAPDSNQTLITRALSISANGSLDLADNSMILDYTGSSPIASIRAALATGFNTGDWTGPGIQSISAHTNPLHAIGYAEASDLGLSSFMGIPVDPTSIVMRYTKYGDNNLDGTVDIGNDFSLYLDGLVNKNASSWVQGDYTFDGKVDLGNDANLFLRSYLTPAVSTPAAQIAAAPALKVNPITSPFTLDNSQSPLDWTLNEI